MMSPKVSQEHKIKTQDKILGAAESLFSRDGYHGTSMDAIVKESGLSKGAIYGYFESKEMLFLALQEKHASLSLDELKSALSQEPTARAKLEKAASLVIGSICEVPDAVCRMDLEFQVASSRMVKIRNRLKKQQSMIISFIADIIREGSRTGEFKQSLDPDAVATILVSAIGGLSTLFVTTGIKLNWDKIRETLTTLVLNGLLVTA
ncbi:MAG: TetR/AcrR family transcriptional regulator [Candidatus Thorarchaeota archaeon]|jgi:AcrR family transcriptional regulator